MPEAYNLHQIEAQASIDGNEIFFDPHRIRVMRKIVEYTPCPQAGPGQWQLTYLDEVVDAAIAAAQIHHITASMFRALRAIDFKATSAIKKLRQRVHGTSNAFET